MKVIFFPLLSPLFFVPSRLLYKQLLKSTCQPYKICFRTSAQITAAELSRTKEKVIKDSFSKKDFFTS